MAIKFLFASSSNGTVIRKLWKLIPESFFGILTDCNCGARDFAFDQEISHFDFQNWNEIPNDIPILLVGFKKILQTHHLNSRKVYNIHPSLLPLHSGWNENVHKSVLQSGQKISGVTLHEVSEQVDGGNILWQFPVPVNKDDTLVSLKDRCQKVETFMCLNFISGKQNNLWWDSCVEFLDL